MPEFKINEELELRVLREADEEELAALVKQNLPHLSPWMIWAIGGYDLEHAQSFIRRNLSDLAEGKPATFGIFYGGELSGCIGFVKLDRENSLAEIGYWISARHQGKGLITKCCRALIDHSFHDLGIGKIEIRSGASNLRSRAVPERLGFELEGQFKDRHPLPGRTDDLVIYSMTREGWRAGHEVRTGSGSDRV